VIPLFVGYAMLVWVLAARHRRQIGGFFAVAAGLAGLVGLNWLHSLLNDWTGGQIYLPVLRAIMYPYTALVACVGAFIAVLPRRSLTGCYRCAYDLEGLDIVGGAITCPECGERNQMPSAYRRSGIDRDDFGVSDRVARPGREASATRSEHEPAHDENAQRQPGDETPAQREQPVR
jgi:pimeloyl-ACP methyl ester carboxylesterase